VGCGEGIFIVEALKKSLSMKGLCTLDCIVNEESTSSWKHGWHSAEELDLEENSSCEWVGFLLELHKENIDISHSDDDLY